MISDVRGRAFTFDEHEPPRRVVSLVPSLTETLFDLGAAADVVGITDFCIFPPDLGLPRVGGTKNPRVDEIRALAPDLVHMNLEENLRRHAEAIEEFASVFVSEPKTVSDVAILFAQLGAMHHRDTEAARLIDALNAIDVAGEPFTFVCPIWKNPWMWCGGDTYVSDLVTRAGGRNLLGHHTRYPQLALEEVLALQPDVVFLPDEPYVFTDADAASIDARVIGPFPGHLFTWHGSRTIQGLSYLREAQPGASARKRQQSKGVTQGG